MAVKPENFVRKLVSLPPDVWAGVQDFRFENRLQTESEAFRQIIRAGLTALAAPTPPPAPKPRPPRKP